MHRSPKRRLRYLLPWHAFASLLAVLVVTGASALPASLIPGQTSVQATETSLRLHGLSDNIVISSEVLGYDLQYRIFIPDGTPEDAELPVIYVTDGQWYIEQGDMAGLMQKMIDDGEMEPAIAVFVDNRDPHNLRNNRRELQFFCNEYYVRFYTNELIPTIEEAWPAATGRESRTILGLSFGGLNSACFGLMASSTFHGIAMQSPAMHPIRTILQSYEVAPDMDLKIFLSSGDHNDNEDVTRRFRDILEQKDVVLVYKEVPFAHTWRNWKPLLDDVLTFYFPPD